MRERERLREGDSYRIKGLKRCSYLVEISVYIYNSINVPHWIKM